MGLSQKKEVKIEFVNILLTHNFREAESSKMGKKPLPLSENLILILVTMCINNFAHF